MNRIYHTWDKWECYPAGFYEANAPKGFTKESAELFYKDFLANIPLFESCLSRVITEWKNSCEHYLTNEKMNRIAWLGQASVCIHAGIPAKFRGGYNLLTESQQKEADLAAFKFLNKWLIANGRSELTWEEAQSKTEANLY
jgi:hypothetical protein